VSGIYRQRHPERTVFYRVFFHYFERFVGEYEDRFEKEYGYFRDPDVRRPHQLPHIHVLTTEGGTAPDGAFHLLCPSCGSKMSIISFIEEPKTIGRIIGHLELTFEAERPPPPHHVQQELLMAAEESGEYF
jgi:hypothetical protein